MSVSLQTLQVLALQNSCASDQIQLSKPKSLEEILKMSALEVDALTKVEQLHKRSFLKQSLEPKAQNGFENNEPPLKAFKSTKQIDVFTTHAKNVEKEAISHESTSCKEVLASDCQQIYQRTLSPSSIFNHIDKIPKTYSCLNIDLLPSLEGLTFALPNAIVTVKKLLGQGAYGYVHEAIYKSKDTQEALKVAFKVNKFINSAENASTCDSIKKEAKIFNILKKADPKDLFATAKIINHGNISQNRYCIIQNLYHKSLADLIRANQFTGFSFSITSGIADQLLNVLNLLRHPDVNIIHGDLKPDNILADNAKSNKIRVVDFGASFRPSSNEQPGFYACSRFYRPPEILFGMPFDHSFDVWSLGLVLFELHTGIPLFPATNSEHLLQMIFELLGPAPEKFVKKVNNWDQHFVQTQEDPSLYHYIPKVKIHCQLDNRADVFDAYLSLSRIGYYVNQPDFNIFLTDETYGLFKQFIKSMLVLDPSDRLTPKELLNHPFMLKIKEIFDLKKAIEAKQETIGNDELVNSNVSVGS